MELDLDSDLIYDPESEVFPDLTVRAPEYLLVAFCPPSDSMFGRPTTRNMSTSDLLSATLEELVIDL